MHLCSKHKAKLYIDILTASLLLCFLQFSANAQTSITSLLIPENGVLNMGPCSIEDSLFVSIEIRSDYDNDLYMTGLIPSCAISKSDLDNYPTSQHDEFDRLFKDFPYTFKKGDIDTFLIAYGPKKVLEIFPYGWKYAVLSMGLTKNVNDPKDTLVSIEYLLKAKKTKLYADGYESYYDFDSVYVNPMIAKRHQWRVKNVKEFDVSIQSQYSKLLSNKKTEDEFGVQNRFSATDEIEIRPYNIVNWEISYFPKDIEADSMLVELYYTREDQTQDTIWVQAKGQGVMQKIDYVDLNQSFSNDTVYLGDIPISEKRSVRAKLYNDGNLPFGIINTSLDKIDPASPDFNWTENIVPLAGNSHLGIGSFASFAFGVEFTEPGEFTLAYTLESDIAERGIFGTPDSVIYRRLYIKGRCIAPHLNANIDTINMGDVVLNRKGCPSDQDTAFTVFNSGNYTLKVDFKLDPPFPTSNFTIDTTSLTIEPNETKEIIITFQSDTFVDDTTDLIIISNMSYPSDTIRVPLLARSTSPVEAVLTLPNIKAKPGRIITLPIILSNSSKSSADTIKPASRASKYSDTLFYNPSLLKYRGYSILETASEFVPPPVITEFSPGNLHIEISQTRGNTFANKDTIIKLQFETYLGDAVETPIRVSNPKFGNSNCDNILTIQESNIHNATFRLDSICGIEYIVSPSSSTLFAIKNLSPNPANENLRLEFNVAAKTYVGFRVYNTFGETLINEQKSIMPKGIYERILNVGNLPVGIYFLEFKAGIYQETKSFTINR